MASDAAASRIVPLHVRLKWDTALSTSLYALTKESERKLFGNQNFKDQRGTIGSLTLEYFATLGYIDQLVIIDRIWNGCIDWKKADKKAKDMIDPCDAVHLPSSFNNEFTSAFKTLGIGFRCETAHSLSRIKRDGFYPLYRNPVASACLSPPHHIKDTVMEINTINSQMGTWKEMKDVVGQTAICIARGMRGATKYPDEEYEGIVMMFAVNRNDVLL